MTKRSLIAIAATFTADPVEASLAFWMREFKFPFAIAFAPYNQVFQQLLDPSSLFGANDSGVNVILIRLEDWDRFYDATELDSQERASLSEHRARMERNVCDLAGALESAAKRSTTPFIVCLCPLSRTGAADSDQVSLFTALQGLIVKELGCVNGVYLITSSEMNALYLVSNYSDPHGDELGHVPYTPLFFTSLGTLIARKIYALKSTSYKAIVLDCDQTLWKGVCGEDGPLGIEIDAPRKALQDFMVRQQNAGKLLCLCSKNNEEDVVEVFKSHPEMRLTLDHIVSRRINWRPKSENIRSLSQELQVALDAFIFIDDDPVECAEVRARCPDVLTLQLPQKKEDIPSFLNHVWVFDQLTVTEEDTKRTVLYKENAAREQFRSQSKGLEEFIAGLELQVQISKALPEHFGRVAQLTQRTNQFNCTTQRRSKEEIQQLCQSRQLECLIVEVKDRFGDYGLVGAMMYHAETDAIEVDTFLLSCRALGRGVEHCMLARLGDIGKQQGLNWVNVNYTATKKNEPALNFLASVGGEFKQLVDGGIRFGFPVEHAVALSCKRGVTENLYWSNVTSGPPVVMDKDTGGRSTREDTFALLSSIATDFRDAEQVFRLIESRRLRPRPGLESNFVEARSPSEEEMAEIWAQVLGLDHVGIEDNFFELGGDSVRAIKVVSRLRDVFDIDLPLQSIFENSTIKKLATVILAEIVRSKRLCGLLGELK